MPRPVQVLEITDQQRRELRQLVNRPTATQREVRRAWIILNRADGLSQEATAERLEINRPVVNHWEKRFRQSGLAGLAEAVGRGRKPSLPEQKKAVIIAEATRPPRGQTRWSVRRMARHAGVSVGSVHAIWQANDLKPHLSRTFKVSGDPQFELKFWDVIGVYLNPPDRALVLCCDEKSQCQALERTQRGLPLGVGHVRTRTHDYTRHGTVTLFAALSYLDGKIFSQTASKHTHKEWLAFLKQLDTQTPEELTLHLIIDNYATHKHPKVKSWLKWRNDRQQREHGSARLVLHFTPTSSSWMNLVERFFRDLTQDVVREGSFTSVRELVESIETYLAQRNLAPKPYRWKAKGEEILAKIQRARQKLESAVSV
jgi:transposase